MTGFLFPVNPMKKKEKKREKKKILRKSLKTLFFDFCFNIKYNHQDSCLVVISSLQQGRVLTGFLFPVNPMKKKKRKEKKKSFLEYH